jgi:hypothetical protein
MKRLWPTGLALLLAVVAIVLAPDTSLRRMSNLEFGASGLYQTYLMKSRTQPDRCRVQNRRASTMRRADPRERGQDWDCDRIPGAGGNMDGWLVRSNRYGEGTILFVPIYAVDDWTYPYFYGFVRGHRAALELPAVRWTQLFVDRLYSGLYLQVALPFDLHRRDGGSGILRSILTVEPERLRVLNTRFEDNGDAYVRHLDDRGPTRFAEPDPELAWLMGLRSAGERTFLMSNRAPNELSILPLPVSLPELYESREDRALLPIPEGRTSLWARSSQADGRGHTVPFDEAETAELRAGFDRYALSLDRALRAEGEFHQTADLLRELLPKRQAASAPSQLALREL